MLATDIEGDEAGEEVKVSHSWKEYFNQEGRYGCVMVRSEGRELCAKGRASW